MHQMRRMTGIALLATLPAVLACDVLVGIRSTWLAAALYVPLPVTGGFIVFGRRKTLSAMVSSAAVLAGVFYVGYLDYELSGRAYVTFATLGGRVTFAAVAVASFVVIRWVLADALSHFFTDLWQILTLPGVSRTIVAFVISYACIVFAFGVVYASIYQFSDARAFVSDRPLLVHEAELARQGLPPDARATATQPRLKLRLLDFFYFSLITATTLGYGDITPLTRLPVWLSMIEALFGALVVAVYVGALVGRIVQELHTQQELGEGAGPATGGPGTPRSGSAAGPADRDGSDTPRP